MRANPEKKREQDRHYAEKSRDKLRERARQYRQENLEAVKKRDAKYRKNNQEKLKVYFQRYYIENRERKIEYAKQYVINNKKSVRQYQKGYREKNFTQLRDYQRERRANSPERYRLYGLAYLARKNNAEGNYNLDQWIELCEFFGCICPCCGENTENFEADHIIPLSWDNTSNWITNIQPLCRRCNTSKNNYYAVDYRPKHVRRWAMEQMNDNC